MPTRPKAWLESRGQQQAARRLLRVVHSQRRSRCPNDPNKRGLQDRSRVSKQKHEQAHQRREGDRGSVEVEPQPSVGEWLEQVGRSDPAGGRHQNRGGGTTMELEGVGCAAGQGELSHPAQVQAGVSDDRASTRARMAAPLRRSTHLAAGNGPSYGSGPPPVSET